MRSKLESGQTRMEATMAKFYYWLSVLEGNVAIGNLNLSSPITM